jgi:hypothetical protein
MKTIGPPSCPSGQPDMPGAQLFGIVGGTEVEPRVEWLEKTVPVTPELLAKAAPVEPQRIFRVAVACQESRCVHFDGTDCKLAQRIVNLVPAATDRLPPCAIRASCRWFGQEGRAACLRCPVIVTHSYDPTAAIAQAATPA